MSQSAAKGRAVGGALRRPTCTGAHVVKTPCLQRIHSPGSLGAAARTRPFVFVCVFKFVVESQYLKKKKKHSFNIHILFL